MPKTDPREEAVFLDALECQSPDELAALLDERCATDSDLRARVVELLRHHGATDRILDGTQLHLHNGRHAERPGEGVGSIVGAYKLLEQIGEGGMGVVYMAEQRTPVERKVALKIIKLGMDTRNVVVRFESERQALAMMDHPNIAKVLDAGATETGRPYFVMNLVRGQPITEFCDTHRLTLRQRLELLAQVCSGVHHAHQKGIIHRDLKPSNIMVTSHDGVPLPKIIDFGIAKAVNQRLTEKTLFTSYGEMIGTPAYMSPEQAEMCDENVDTRSDIYSLGVLMYELLTGTTPFHLADKSYRDIQDTIKHHEPVLPSTRVNMLGDTTSGIVHNRASDTHQLHRFIHGELDWIVMRCLSKDRRLRYETARDLALDIQRFLSGDPVDAAAPSATYRLTKYFSKHRVALSVAIVLMLMLVACTVTSSIFAMWAHRAAQRARDAEQLAQLRFEEANAARFGAERDRDRALSAEKQLAAMNRQQRNRAAFYKAVAMLSPSVAIEHVGDPSAPRQVVPGVPMQLPRDRDVGVIPMRRPHKLTVASRLSAQEAGSQVLTATLGGEQAVLSAPRPKGTTEQTANAPTAETEFLTRLLDEQREEFGDEDAVVADTLSLLGVSRLKEKRYAEAVRAFRECLLIRTKSKADSVDRADAAYRLGLALLKEGKVKQGRHYLERAVSLLSSDDARSQQLRQAVKKSLEGQDANGHQ